MSEIPISARAQAQDEVAFVEKLRSGKPILFKPRGRSMEPHLQDGTVVMIDPVTRPPHVGEVVLAVFAGVTTLHRVVKLRANQVWLWGDAMRHGEGPIPIDAVVGIARTAPLPFKIRFRLACRRMLFTLARLFGG
ncbi:MAG: S24/S26 family peptidase [Deltaproteobacteria bacterium]|nr:S24/S26 family peptidase [Deltaproteobacteria bacterium]